jgi:hypothetical protein
VEFTCLSVSTLLVLQRLLKHALEPESTKRRDLENPHGHGPSSGSCSEARSRATGNILAIHNQGASIQFLFNIFAGTVLLFCGVGVCCGLAGAVFYSSQKDFAQLANNAVNATTQKDTSQSLKFKTYVEVAGLFQAQARSAQHFCEVIPLHLLMVVFILVGYRRYQATLLFFTYFFDSCLLLPAS